MNDGEPSDGSPDPVDGPQESEGGPEEFGGEAEVSSDGPEVSSGGAEESEGGPEESTGGAEEAQEIRYRAIGTIHSPFTAEEGMPIQGGFSEAEGTVELDAEYADGLSDLDGFSHVILLYHFDRSEGYDLEPEPYMEDESHGVFATRAPRRPNPIGVSVVELTAVDGATLHVRGIDILDGTPLLDVKPFVPAFNGVENATIGWLEDAIDNESRRRADDRFLD